LKEWKDRATKAPQSDVREFVVTQIKDLHACFLAMKFIRGENWVPEHWEELGILIEYPTILKINDVKVIDFLNHSKQIQNNLNQIKLLNEKAKGQGTIRAALREVKEWSLKTEFSLVDQMETVVIREWKDLFSQVSDMQATISSLTSLQFSESFVAEIQLWATKLTTLYEALFLLNQIQREWLHPAPIFLSGALPSHQDKYNSLDTQFRSIMDDVKKDPQITSLLNKYEIVTLLTGLHEGLEQCQAALSSFLETKRSNFPRL
jgi:dynein heavy chain 2